MDEAPNTIAGPISDLAPETRAEVESSDVDPYATVAPSPGDLAEHRPSPTLDRFRVLRPLARGGLGEVFVALDGDLGREVALKEIQGRHADHPASRARFVLEAEVLGRLEHPGIVPIYGMGHHPDGRPYYAMRLIRGETLREAIDRYHSDESKGLDPGERTLALRRLLGRFAEACQTIDYAHGQGVLHRDIKPANVMLGPHGEVLVVDWGLAKVMGKNEVTRADSDADADPILSGEGSMTQAGASIGTPAYMSPEQAEGDLDRIGPGSDIYSLGAMLYQILTGRPPVQGKTLAEVLGKVKQGDFPRPRKLDRKLPKALEAITLKAMASRPEGRYSTARGLADDLERWMAGEPTSARHEMFPQRLWRWARRRPDVAFYVLVLASGDLLYGGELVEPFVARLGIDPRFYLLFIVVVALTCLALPFFAIIISQFPMALGAVIGGIFGLARGDVQRGIRRGAALGAKVGLIAGSVVVVGFFATIGPDLIEKISSSSPTPSLAGDPADASDLAAHQGTWLLVSQEIEGAKSPAHQTGGVTRIVTGRDVVRIQGTNAQKSTIQLHTGTSPKGYDAKLGDGPYQGMTIRGIYQLDGDQLTTCAGRAGMDRPREFTTKPGSGLMVQVWKRVKP